MTNPPDGRNALAPVPAWVLLSGKRCAHHACCNATNNAARTTQKGRVMNPALMRLEDGDGASTTLLICPMWMETSSPHRRLS